MIKIYEYNEPINLFMEDEADGVVEDCLIASFKYEKDVIKFLLEYDVKTVYSLLIRTNDDLFNPYEFVFMALKENKENICII